MVLCFTSTAHANRGMDKVKSGAKAIFTSPLEIGTNTLEQVNKNDNKLFGLIAGLLEGSGQMVNKAIGGLVDVVTFPIDC